MTEKEMPPAPKRKKKVSETEETPIAKKTATSKKTTAPKVDLENSENNLVEDVKDTEKNGSAKTTAAKTPKKTVAAKKKLSVAEPLTEAASTEDEATAKAVTESSSTETAPTEKAAVGQKPESISSAEMLSPETVSKTVETELESPAPTALSVEADAKTEEDSTEAEAQDSEKKELSPVFKELSEPKLPELPQENRARLQMQSPNRIFLYWSIKGNPFETLKRALPGRAENYTLTIKLVNLSTNAEEIYPVDSNGSWWFNVNSNTAYRAEIGFASANRPFVRLMFSNTVETPRSAPSPNTDWSTDFTVSAEQFAEVLDAAGYQQDAFDVAIAGDDKDASDAATQETFVQLIGKSELESNAEELRLALFALASGVSLESLRDQISAGLYALLEAIMRENAEKLSAEKVLAALHDNFAFEGDEEFLAPVFGASSINFPRGGRRPKFSPISSLKGS